MKSERRFLDILPQAALAVMLAAFCFALYTQLHETIVNPGDRAPNFSVTADNGRTVTAKDFGGKLLLVNFWATWCPPCVDEIPGLNEMYRQLGPKGLVIVAISQDIQLSYGTIQIPESYLIDRNGRVIEKYISSQPWASPQMIEHVSSLL